MHKPFMCVCCCVLSFCGFQTADLITCWVSETTTVMQCWGCWKPKKERLQEELRKNWPHWRLKWLAKLCTDVMIWYYHWRQPRRGCRGHIPSNILVGRHQWEYPSVLLRTFVYSRSSHPRTMTAFKDIFYLFLCSKIQDLPQNLPKSHWESNFELVLTGYYTWILLPS